MIISKTLIFPVVMFALAAISFAYGTWQYFISQQIIKTTDARVAHILTVVERSSLESNKKQQIYAAIMTTWPKPKAFWSFDFSDSLASPIGSDFCITEGQRSICKILLRQSVDHKTYQSVCGSCQPQ